MTALNRAIELQTQGLQDSEISKTLRDEGFSPKDINDSLNQAKVKSAVSQDMPEATQQTQEMTQSIQPGLQGQDPSMQQSIMPQQQVQMPEPPQQQEQTFQTPSQEQEQQYYYPETPQAYGQGAYYAPQETTNTETITEIAEQVVIEKLDEFKKKIGNMVSFRNKVEDELTNLSQRLEKIEDSIENLQQSVIKKVGEFGESSAAVHKDLDSLHNTVSKLMNPLIDNYKELKKMNKKSTS